MILVSIILFNSFFTNGSRLGCILRSFCWYGLTSLSNGITCYIMLVSKVFKSPYVHAKTSLYFLNSLTNRTLSCGEHLKPKLTIFGFYLVPRLIDSYFMDELCILQLVSFLNLSSRSYKSSILTTDLGIILD